MNEDNKTYYIEINGSKAYFQYDKEKHAARRLGGNTVTISEEKLNDFLHTAKILGFKAGEL